MHAPAIWDSSAGIQIFVHAAWQSTTILTTLATLCYVIIVSFKAARRMYRQLPRRRPATVAIYEDEEIARLKRARQKSLENAKKARFGRASTAPPC